MAIPIWKDTFYTKTGVTSYLDYSVSVGGTTIYSGRAYPKPGTTTINIKVNDIVQDLFNNWAIFFGTHDESVVTRSISAVLTAGAQSQTYDFIYDWSYENNTALRTTLDPIIKRVDGEQRIFIVDGNQVECCSLNDEEVDSYTTNGVTFTRCDGHDYALYYVDKYGLWETFLLEGNCYLEDTIERNTIAINNNNGAVDEWDYRNTLNYHNKITKKATLRTGWLTDEEATRMDSLIGSIQVWLHDFKADKIMPVVITDTTMKRKTYKNEGNALVRYDITADVAYDYSRR